MDLLPPSSHVTAVLLVAAVRPAAAAAHSLTLREDGVRGGRPVPSQWLRRTQKARWSCSPAPLHLCRHPAAAAAATLLAVIVLTQPPGCGHTDPGRSRSRDCFCSRSCGCYCRCHCGTSSRPLAARRRIALPYRGIASLAAAAAAARRHCHLLERPPLDKLATEGPEFPLVGGCEQALSARPLCPRPCLIPPRLPRTPPDARCT